jgi:mercuric ion transport protein
MASAYWFPALGSLAATIGLGCFAQFEGVFINTLLPIFAVIALIANVTSSFIQRRIVRSIFGLIGPIFILATLYLF